MEDTSFKSTHVKLDFGKLDSKLFGREEEVRFLRGSHLAAAVDVEASGAPTSPYKVLLISGYSGSGKTTLVEHTFKNNLFGSGKYDQPLYESEKESSDTDTASRNTVRSNGQRQWHGMLDACEGLCQKLLKKAEELEATKDGDDQKEAIASCQAELIHKYGPEMKVLIDLGVPSLQTFLLNRSTGTADQQQEGILNKWETDIKEQDQNKEKSGSSALTIQDSSFWTQRAIASIDALVNCIAVYTSSIFSGPPVIFLDDVQWADSASLDLLQGLMTDNNGDKHTSSGSTLFVLAFRENEVDDQHPVGHSVRAMEERNSMTLDRLQLKDLSVDALNGIISLLVERQKEDTLPLTEVIFDKCRGNIFFSLQLIKSLQDEAMIYYSFKTYRWDWDRDNIVSEANLSDNVAELVLSKMRRLPKDLQRVLQIAAFMGTRFNAKHLQLVLGATLALNPETEDEKEGRNLSDLLQVAVDSHLIAVLQNEDTYRFCHDRIQEAAYSFADDSDDGIQKAELHWKIGTSVLPNMNQELFPDEEQLLLGLHQLNRGSKTRSSPMELVQLAILNGTGGRVYTSKRAFFPAVRCFQRGVEILESLDGWENYESLTKEQSRDLATAYACVGKHDDATSLCQVLLSKARSVEEKLEVRVLLIESLERESKWQEVLNNVAAGLKEAGEPMTMSPSGLQIAVEFFRTNRRLAKYCPEDYMSLPTISKPRKALAVRLIQRVTSPAMMLGLEKAIGLSNCRLMKLTLTYGLDKYSPISLVSFANMKSMVLGDIKGAYDLAETGIKMAELPAYRDMQARTMCYTVVFSMHLQRPWHEVRERALKAYHLGMQSGDVHAAYGGSWSYLVLYLWSGLPLTPLHNDILAYLRVFREYGHWTICLKCLLPVLARLQGWVVPEEISKELDEECRRTWKRPGVRYHLLREMIAQYHFGEIQELVDNEREYWIEYSAFPFTMTEGPGHTLFVGLMELEVFQHKRNLKWIHKRRAKKMQGRLRDWTSKGNVNCHHMTVILEVELMRVEGKAEQDLVEAKYLEAIRFASRAGFVNHAALANELFGKYMFRLGEERTGKEYLSQALSLYGEWEANAKVGQMLEEYPFLKDHDMSSSSKRGGNFRGRSRFDPSATKSHGKSTEEDM